MIAIGTQFMVMGDWDLSPEPKDKTVIRMPVPPHHTYGCWNKTTQMCIEELERLVIPGMTVLDFGTGSGILAVVAYLLGAEKVYATELDPPTVKYAQKVWALNNVPVMLVEEETLPEVDLCVANIGDSFWDLVLLPTRGKINAKTTINISNSGQVVVV